VLLAVVAVPVEGTVPMPRPRDGRSCAPTLQYGVRPALVRRQATMPSAPPLNMPAPQKI